jgi:hypothetical protein
LGIDGDIASIFDDFDSSSKMTRANLAWTIDGVLVSDPTKAQLLSLKEGDLAVLTSATQKNDQFGFRFSHLPRYLPVANYPHCAARALAAMELALPMHGTDRAQSPLLPADRFNHPWTVQELSSTLTALQRKLSLDTSKGWHAWRVYLACALLSTHHDHPTIQAMCHWRTIDAERLYARIEPTSYAKCLLAASSASVTSVLTRNLPQLDISDQLQELSSAVAATTTAVAPTTAARPPPPTTIPNIQQPAQPTKRKRGRPRKHPLPNLDTPKRAKGRPRKHSLSVVAPTAKKRGRPCKQIMTAPGLACPSNVLYSQHNVAQLCCGALLIGEWFADALHWPMNYVRMTWELLLMSDNAEDVPSNFSPIAQWVREVDWCVRHPHQVWPQTQALLVRQATCRVIESCVPHIHLTRLPAHQRVRLYSIYGCLIPLSPPLFILLTHHVLKASKAHAWLQVSPSNGPPVAGFVGDCMPGSRRVGQAGVAATLNQGHWEDSVLKLGEAQIASINPNGVLSVNCLTLCAELRQQSRCVGLAPIDDPDDDDAYTGESPIDDPGSMWPDAVLYRHDDGTPQLTCGVQLMDTLLELPETSAIAALRRLLHSDEVRPASDHALSLWVHEMVICMEHPFTFWHVSLAHLVAKEYNQLAEFGHWHCLSSAQKLNYCAAAALLPLSPQLFVATAHEALCYVGQYRYLQVTAEGITRGGYIGDVHSRVARCYIHRVAAEIIYGHWDRDTLLPQHDNSLLPIQSLDGVWRLGIAGLGQPSFAAPVWCVFTYHSRWQAAAPTAVGPPPCVCHLSHYWLGSSYTHCSGPTSLCLPSNSSDSHA